MPLLGTRGAASAQGFGLFSATGIGGPYWIARLGGASDDQGRAIATDINGNIYLAGTSFAGGSADFQIAKYNTSGTIQWQRSLGVSGSIQSANSIAVDNSGNIYLCGNSDASGTGEFQIAKYDTSGTIQWQRRLGAAGSTEQGYSVAIDSSGNVYVSGYSDTTGPTTFQIAKFDNSGNIQWQRRLGDSTISAISQSVAVDGSGNVYACGVSVDSGGNNRIQIAKYNTSGTIQWQRRLGSGSADYGYSVAVDGSGNVYVCGTSAISTIDIQVAKYNTSGTIQWQRSLASSSADYGQSIAVDSSGNCYVCGYSNATGTNDFQIAKYNTSGTIQWQRRLGGSSDDRGLSVATDISGNVYVCGYSLISSIPDFLFAKLPGNGSLTGTYSVGGVSYTYAASGLTDASSSLTDAATSLTDAASSLTTSATSLTSATTTLTSSVTTL